jgi:hypothetical protein
VETFVGLAEDAMTLCVQGQVASGGGSNLQQVAFGMDSTSAPAPGQIVPIAGLSASLYVLPCWFTPISPIGRHAWVWLELNANTGTVTWAGTSLTGAVAGINGVVRG